MGLQELRNSVLPGEEVIVRNIGGVEYAKIHLGKNDIRDEIQRALDLKGWGPQSKWDAMVKKIPGLQLHERRNVIADDRENIDCARYLFQSLLRTGWTPDDLTQLFDNEMCPDPFAFLKERGYALTADPVPGNIVVYGNAWARESPPRFIDHVGLLGDDYKVISKWGEGHAFRHPFGIVPLSYNNDVFLMEKTR